MRQIFKNITTDDGVVVQAQCPVILSASRSTDIPAYYADWFFDRLEKGYARWRNPFNGRDCYVSFADTRFIVFWSKNPLPLIPHLWKLKELDIGCYVQYTLNDYVLDGFEPNVPPLIDRINTFKQVVDILGKEAVIWRFDPLILTDKISIQTLLEKISGIADKLNGYTEKLVFSFADISSYKNVGNNLKNRGIQYREWREGDMLEFAMRLAELNQKKWQYKLATCAEVISLEEFGIEHNRCVDHDLMSRLASDDVVLQNQLYLAKKDKGQRKLCGCITSKDVGYYNTCPHGCIYCYANSTPQTAIRNYRNHLSNPQNDAIV